MASLAEAFSFGGGLKNGGLSNDAMNLIRNICRFDYMGAAEYEFGAVPESLSYIAQNAEYYMEMVFDVYGSDVYVFARTEDLADMLVVLQGLADGEIRPKCYYNSDKNIFSGDTIGGLELDNHFFFFNNENSFKNMVSLFA